MECAELDVLYGVHNIFINSSDLKFAIYSYLKKGDETRIKDILEEYRVEASNTEWL